MGQLREHQKALQLRAKSIVSKEISGNKTVAHVTPGGGKSAAASVFSKELLDGKIIDRVIWVCPRTSLTRQAAEGFQNSSFNPKYSIRKADNSYPLFRDTHLGKIGYSTTYQSIAAQPDLHLRAVQHHKFLLVLDEPHHLKDEKDGMWIEAIKPLQEKATHTLLMTGTIERHDKKLVPFIEYEKDGNTLFPVKDIIYSRYDAFLEEAIIPIEFEYENGWAEYEDNTGKHKVEIAQALDDEVSKVIQTFLNKTEFRDRLINRGMQAFIEGRKRYPSRCIIICATQKAATAISEQVAKTYKVDVALAISDDPDSQDTIKRFRQGEFHVLVTVGMAYEGLDVPDCKYLICLTSTRSIPWLEQAFARVTRVDYTAVARGLGYDQQKAHIFVPDDPRMQSVVAQLKAEQDRGIRDKKAKKKAAQSESMGGNKNVFIPLGAESSGTTIDILGADIPEDLKVVASALPQELDEREVRRRIEMLSRRRDAIRRLPRGSTNKLLYSEFGKSRSKMAPSELSKVLRYLESLNRSK